VPFRFRDWDLDFIAWLNRTGKQVDFLTDDDVAALRSGDELAAAYDLVVYPGHAEYVTEHEYDVVQRFRDRGGNLMFLSANNFFWKVRRDGRLMTKVALWRRIGRPEAALVGAQYVASDYGGRQAGYLVHGSSWAFAGTGLVDGDRFGRYGFEIDARSPESPPGTQVLASIPDLMGPGRSAEMTYYETPGGAKVFAAGALNFTASIGDPAVAGLVENVWSRLSRP
jgi:N,N-dimethylformamidase beta subunit-like protein